MSITIVQKPVNSLSSGSYYSFHVPINSPCVFSVSGSGSTGNYQHSFFAVIYVYDEVWGTGPVFYTMVDFKVSDPTVGIGTIDLSTLLSHHVSSDTLAVMDASYQARFKQQWQSYNPTPIHLIDKFSKSKNASKKCKIQFWEKYATTPNGPVQIQTGNAEIRGTFWNGCLNHHEITGNFLVGYGAMLQSATPSFGLGPLKNNQASARLLTDGLIGHKLKPEISQKVKVTDYMTLAFLSGWVEGTASLVYKYTFTSYNAAGSVVVTGDTVISGTTVGARYGGGDSTFALTTDSRDTLTYVGVGPANLINGGVNSSGFASTCYGIQLKSAAGTAVSQEYIFHMQQDDCKGYETIRLTWLNRWGTWDYYNFTKKSYQTLDTDSEEYSPVAAEWSKDGMKINGQPNQLKTFNIKSKKSMVVNSDWVGDEESIWLEGLFSSPEVYILRGDEGDAAIIDINNARPSYYTTPVKVNSSYERYTSANDKVAQYEVELEYQNFERKQLG